MAQPAVGIVFGSSSDEQVMQGCADVLKELGIPYEMNVMSAHRTPATVARYAGTAAERGVKVLIAGAVRNQGAVLKGIDPVKEREISDFFSQIVEGDPNALNALPQNIIYP